MLSAISFWRASQHSFACRDQSQGQFDQRKIRDALLSTEGYHPVIPDDTPHDIADLLLDTWSLEPELRPSASELVHRLEAILADFGRMNSVATNNNSSSISIPIPSTLHRLASHYHSN